MKTRRTTAAFEAVLVEQNVQVRADFDLVELRERETVDALFGIKAALIELEYGIH